MTQVLEEPQTVRNELTDILRRAKEILLACGWCQGQLGDLLGRRCLVGAVNLATTGQLMDLSTLEMVRRNRVLDTLGAAGEWNDAEVRTEAEVIALIDETLARIAEPTEVIA